MEFVGIARLHSLICFIASLILNSSLIWLIRRRSPKEMSRYSCMLLQTALCDLLLSVITELTQVFCFSHRAKLLFYMNGPFCEYFFRCSPSMQCAMVMLWMLFFAFSIDSLGVQFLYRYLVLTRNKDLALSQYLMMLSVPFATMLTFSVLFYFSDNQNDRLHYYGQLAIIFAADSNFVHFNASVDINNPLLITCSVILIFTGVIGYFLIVLCARGMIRHVRANAALAHCGNEAQRRAASLSKQITWTLCLLALLPAIFSAEALFICTSAFLAPSSDSNNFFTNLQLFVALSFHWLPVLNPLITMLTVRPYRRAIIATIRCVGEGRHSSTIVAIGTTQQNVVPPTGAMS